MKSTGLHLNLLHESEQLSSSPVRLRVMAPILAALACAGALVWWGTLAMRGMLLDGQVEAVKQDLERRTEAHAGILERMGRLKEVRAEIAQLDMYMAGRRTVGEFLAKLAETVPPEVQITQLAIPEPAPQDLKPPKNAKGGKKAKPLLGPTGTVEKVRFELKGRATTHAPLTAMMAALEKEDFKEWVKIDKTVKSPDLSPNVKSFHQEAVAAPGQPRMLVFDVEYRLTERRFEK